MNRARAARRTTIVNRGQVVRSVMVSLAGLFALAAAGCGNNSPDDEDRTGDGDADSDADADADADTDGDADTDADADADTDADSDADSDADTDADSDVDGDGDGDADVPQHCHDACEHLAVCEGPDFDVPGCLIDCGCAASGHYRADFLEAADTCLVESACDAIDWVACGDSAQAGLVPGEIALDVIAACQELADECGLEGCDMAARWSDEKNEAMLPCFTDSADCDQLYECLDPFDAQPCDLDW